MRTYQIDDRYNLEFWKAIHGYFDWMDVYDLVAKTIKDGEVFIEIGAFLGRSALYLSSRLVQEGKLRCRIICVDVWWENSIHMGSDRKYFILNPLPVFLANVEQAGFRDNFRAIHETSQNAVDLITPEEKTNIGGVFIDGDHNFGMVETDIALYYPLVKKGGFFGGHDYSSGWPGVQRAVNDFQKNFQPITSSGNAWYCIKQ